MSKTLPRPKRQPEAWLHIEERNGTMFKFTTDYAFCRELQTLRIEAHCPFKIFDTECKDC